MSYKLNYWNVPGRGESIRLMLAIGGFQFENNFIPLPLPIPNPPDLSPAPFDDGTWSKMKGSTPWGSVPTLTLPDGESFGQQRAIVRYLGKLIQREGTGGVLSIDPTIKKIPHLFIFQFEFLSTKKIASFNITNKIGFSFCPGCDLDSRNIVDLPVIYPRMKLYENKIL